MVAKEFKRLPHQEPRAFALCFRVHFDSFPSKAPLAQGQGSFIPPYGKCAHFLYFGQLELPLTLEVFSSHG